MCVSHKLYSSINSKPNLSETIIIYLGIRKVSCFLVIVQQFKNLLCCLKFLGSCNIDLITLYNIYCVQYSIVLFRSQERKIVTQVLLVLRKQHIKLVHFTAAFNMLINITEIMERSGFDVI